MPQIYNPQTALMYPGNGDILDPSERMLFTARVNGSICKGFVLRIYSMSNYQEFRNAAHMPNAQNITKYNGDLISFEVPDGILDPGEEYKWDIAMAGVKITASFSNKVFTAANHNLNTGDTVWLNTIGEGEVFDRFTTYYVGKIDKDTFSLYAYLEGARNGVGALGEDVASTTAYLYPIGVSEQIVFKMYTSPTLTLTSETLDSYIHEFVPTYSQAEGTIINSFVFEYYSGSDSNIRSSGTIYSSNIRYTIDGLLSGYTYHVRFTATDNVGNTCTTGWVDFPVEYDTTSLGMVPVAYNDSVNSAVDVLWDGITQITGVPSDVEGTGYDYVPNYNITGNTALKLYNDETLTYNNIACYEGGSLPMFNWEPLGNGWSGKIFRMDNTDTGDFYELWYDDGVFTSRVGNDNDPDSVVETVILEAEIKEGKNYYIGITNDGMVLVPNSELGVMMMLDYDALEGVTTT